MSSVLSRFSGSYASTSRIDNRRSRNSDRNHDTNTSELQKRRRCGMIITTLFVILVIVALSLTIVHINQAPSTYDSKPTVPPIRAEMPIVVSSPNISPPITTTIQPTSTPTITGYQACNGYEHLCDIPVNEVFYAALHNAESSIEDGVTVLPNHELSLEKALVAGYRGINLDIGKCSSYTTQPIRLAHGLCNLGTRDPIEVFTNIQSFLQDNINEVIIMPIEINNGLDGGAISSFNEIYSLMEQVPNFTNLLYQHTGFGDAWPTLRDMISNNKRIVTFFYNGATLCTDDPNGCPVGFHDWFIYAAETEFQFSTADDILTNTDTSCSITRGGQGLRNFFGINYFTEFPSASTCEVLHTYTNVDNHIKTCTSINANVPAVPNIIFVDYWNIGSVLDVVASYNEQLSNSTTLGRSKRQLVEGNVTINIIGSFETVMDQPEQDLFLLSCSQYYNSLQQDLNVSNIYCSNVMKQNLISRPETRRQRYLQKQQQGDASMLQITVLVRGDKNVGSNMDNDKAPTNFIFVAPLQSESSTLVQALSKRSEYFFQVKNITVSVQNDTTTTVSGDSVQPTSSNVPSTAPSMIPSSSPVPSTSFAPIISLSRIPVVVPVVTSTPISTKPVVVPTKAPIITLVPTTVPTMPMVCNGHANLCDRKVDDILFATIHNGASTKEDGVIILPNHEFSLEKALIAGYRGINLDIGICNDVLRLVHGFCIIGYREIIPTFGNIVTFLQQNPNEVVIMPIQVDNSIGGTVTLQDIDTILLQVPGMKELMYNHPVTATEWPTLRELIAANTRILFFAYNYGESCYVTNTCPLGIHDWFQYAGESEYEFNSPEQIIADKQYSCAITRGNNNALNFYGVNVFTRFPTRDNSEVLHTKENLLSHLSNCSSITGQSIVNLLIVDYWDIGDVLTVADAYNANL